MVNINNGNFTSIEQVTGQYLTKTPQKTQNTGQEIPRISFEEILKEKSAQEAGGLRFSKHANERLASRNIDLSAEQLTRLTEGTSRARTKGIRESLVMVDDIAFIVNVKNNTVVTAVGDSDDKIFTNIDGAVII